MINIENEKVEIPCDQCERKHRVTIKQVKNKHIINCLCGRAIELQADETLEKATRDINKAFKSLEKTFKSF